MRPCLLYFTRESKGEGTTYLLGVASEIIIGYRYVDDVTSLLQSRRTSFVLFAFYQAHANLTDAPTSECASNAQVINF